MSDRQENSSDSDGYDTDGYDTEGYDSADSDSSNADPATRATLKAVAKYPNEKDIKEKTSQVILRIFPAFFRLHIY